MPSVYIPKKDGLYHDPKTGRTMQHEHYATRIYWSRDMIDYLRCHFPTTLNDELAGCLGVSVRTMIRKARELGLEKDPQWLAAVWEERRLIAQSVSRSKGNSGQFKKGERTNPAGEFKPGHKESDETKAKRIESIKRWCRSHPKELNERAVKIRATRMRNYLTKSCP